MVEYRVRSVSLLNLVNDVRAGRLVPDAYFQRNLVWREVHKKDFIKTILLGLPFPQIFISKGLVNVETMSTVSCIVDGQQRTNAINDYIKGAFDVDGRYYSDLGDIEKSDFLKYEIAVIELDLVNDDPKVQEIFQRINRTSNSLTSVEKLASQYSTSEYMLVAKLLADQIDLSPSAVDDFREDPNIPDEFYAWARTKDVRKFVKLLNDRGVFNPRELARKNNLMHVLNIMSTLIGGFSNRNEKATEFLDDFALVFPQKDDLVSELEGAADVILKLGLKMKSYWLNKANMFSLVVAVANAQREMLAIDIEKFKSELEKFESAPPEEYRLAAAEAVNSTRARSLRNLHILNLIRRSVLSRRMA
jgi:hypothetical protein